MGRVRNGRGSRRVKRRMVEDEQEDERRKEKAETVDIFTAKGRERSL